MITKDEIKHKNVPVIVKWDKPLTDANGNVTDGVMAGQAEEFIPRIESESRLLGELRYIEMDGETQDIQALRVRPKLKNMDKISIYYLCDCLINDNTGHICWTYWDGCTAMVKPWFYPYTAI